MDLIFNFIIIIFIIIILNCVLEGILGVPTATGNHWFKEIQISQGVSSLIDEQ